MGLGLWVYCGVRVLWGLSFNAILIWKLEQADCGSLGSCDISGSSLRFVGYRIFRKRSSSIEPLHHESLASD